MSIYKEGAASGKHHLDGPPRLNSSRCGNYHTAANALNQSSSGAPSQVRKPEGDRMSQELATRRQEEFAIIEQVVIKGDLSVLTGEQRVAYYNKVCESVGLNPLTSPFSYLEMKGKLVLYANKDCSEQLRKINGVSIEGLECKLIEDIYIVTAKAKDKAGRIDQATGAVVVGNLRGEAKANAIMKAETKAKRRVTLSICGMGTIDDSEVDSIPNAKRIDVDMKTGEIKTVEAPAQIESMLKKEKISAEQVAELSMILDECEVEYRNNVYGRVKNVFKTDDLSGIPSDMYELTKSAALRNMQKNYEKLANEAHAELVAQGAV